MTLAGVETGSIKTYVAKSHLFKKAKTNSLGQSKTTTEQEYLEPGFLFNDLWPTEE